MSHVDAMVAWLNDAHALEKSLVQVLEHRVNDMAGQPQMQTMVQRHLEETRRHAELVQGCIERLGGQVSTIKSSMGVMSGMFQNVSTAVAADQMVKNALADYTAENFEIASYTSLLSAAEFLGDTVIADVCRQILRDEIEMASWLEQQIPLITQVYLGEQERVHTA